MSITPEVWDASIRPIPKEVAHFFKPSHFSDYPRIQIPQEFRDSRGTIGNIADGSLGDVAIIESSPGAVRLLRWGIPLKRLVLRSKMSITLSSPSGKMSLLINRFSLKINRCGARFITLMSRPFLRTESRRVT